MIDDNPADIRLMIEAFKEIDLFKRMECFYAYEGEEAMNFLQASSKTNQDLKLILLDLNLPRINGKELLAFIKNDLHLRKIPVIVVSNSDYYKDMEDCIALNANGYLQKPNDFKSLVKFATSIQNCLENNEQVSTQQIMQEYGQLKAAI